ncbi:hypothetical protein GCT62_07835 [Yersinia enterocolitica]|nr:hypothetical protein [Yersinia enterocolitica]
MRRCDQETSQTVAALSLALALPWDFSAAVVIVAMPGQTIDFALAPNKTLAEAFLSQREVCERFAAHQVT